MDDQCMEDHRLHAKEIGAEEQLTDDSVAEDVADLCLSLVSKLSTHPP